MLELKLHPDYPKDMKKVKLSSDQKSKIVEDVKKLVNGEEIGKQLTGTLFPLKELKYRSWGIRVIFLVEVDCIYLLSISRKKDGVASSYKDAIERFNRD